MYQCKITYQEWNKILAKYFFNESKSEKEVYLYITKQDITRLGNKEGLDLRDEEIFQDYINALISDSKKEGGYSIINRPLSLFKVWQMMEKEQREKRYPPFIAYLVAFILPLTVPDSSEYNYNNYYGRVNDYFHKYGLINNDQEIGTTTFSKLDDLWKDLEKWSWIDKNMELGVFELPPFRNERWVHVGKPLSQAIFPVSAVNKLHEFYDYLNFVPGENINEQIIREKILKHGEKHIGLDPQTVKVIQDRNNEFGQSIVNLIQKNYNNWTGHSESTSVNKSSSNSNTIAELRLCFKDFDPLDSSIDYFFRLYSKVDYPENLFFSERSKEYEVEIQSQGWSKPIRDLPFRPDFELIDKHSKWKARFRDKDIRLFIKGSVHNLSGWVEVKKVYPAAQMKALVKDSISKKFEEWEPAFRSGKFTRLNIDHDLEGFNLYEFQNPQESHPSLSIFDKEDELEIELKGGLKLKPNTYLGSVLPNILIEKGSGNETVTVENSKGISRLLQRRDTEIPLWTIPEEFSYENEIKIKLNGDVKEQEEIKIIEAEEYANPINRYFKTYTDKYGNIKVLDTNDFRNPDKIDFDRQDINTLKLSLKPFKKKTDEIKVRAKSGNRLDNALLNFISYKKKISFADFFQAYEEILNQKFDKDYLEKLDQGLNLLRRLSLRSFYDLGHVQIDYSNRRIATNIPKLILIPTNGGRKALLIGGRSSTLLSKVRNEVHKLGLSINFTKSAPENKKEFLLPDRVTIIANESHADQTKFNRLAHRCGLQYDHDEFFQLSLVKKCSSLDEYFNSLRAWGYFSDEGYKASRFDEKALKFEEIDLEQVNQQLSLIKYKVNTYKYRHIFWHEGKAFEINKDWGRYLLLSRQNKQIIFREKINHSKGVFYVPGSTPLPSLLDKALVLISGRIPDEKYMEFRDIDAPHKIYKNVPLRFADMLFNKINQPPLPI